MNQKYKKTFKYLNYVEHLSLLVSTITRCVSISVVASLCSCWYYEFCNRNKSLYNHWRNQKSINQLLEKDKLNTIKV